MTKTAITCLVFAVIGGIAAPILLAGAIQARESRMKAVDSALAKLEGLDERLRVAQNDVANLEQDLLNIELVWGKPVAAGQTQVVDPQQGLVQFGVGLPAGNGGPPPVFQAFGENPNGEGVYLGEFAITASQPGAATGKLTRRPLPGEANQWGAAAYRVRTKVPASFTNTIDELLTDFNIAAQDLQEEQVRLQRAQQQLAASQDILARRESELSGDTQAADDAEDSVKEGLVTAIEKATAERDKLLASVDRLRRVYRDKSKTLNSIIDEIRQLAERLPRDRGGMAARVSNVPVVR